MKFPETRIATGGCGQPLCALCTERGAVRPRALKEILADIDAAAEHGENTVFFDDHEPLLHPEIKAILAACVRHRLAFFVATSGLAASSARILENLRRLGLKGLLFRLAGFHPEIGQLVWGRSGMEERTENALNTLLSSTLPFEVEIPVTPFNRGVLDRSLLELEQRYGLSGRLSDPQNHFADACVRAAERLAIRRGERTPTQPASILFYPVEKTEDFDPARCHYRGHEDSDTHDLVRAWLKRSDETWEVFETTSEFSFDLVVSKNLRGRMALHTSNGFAPYRLDDTCRSCPRLCRCGAAFVPDESLPQSGEIPGPACPASYAALCEALAKNPQRLVVEGASTICRAVAEDSETPPESKRTLETWEVADIAKGFGYGVVDYDLRRDAIDGAWRLVLGQDSPVLKRGPGALAVLQLSSACVNRCLMCSLPQMFHGQWVSSEDSVRLLEELYLLGYDTCDVFGGEITLRGDFVELMRFAKETGLRATFISSGHNLDRERIGRLSEAGVDKCTIALDAPDAELHDAIKNRPGIYEQAMRAIRVVLDDARLPLEVNTVVLTQNVYDLPILHEMLVDMGVRRHRLFYCIDGLFGMGDPPYLTYEQSLDFIRDVHPRLNRLSRERGTLIDWCPPVSFSGSVEDEARRLEKGIYTDDSVSCTAPGREIYVMVDGSVYPCVNPTIWMHEAVGKVGTDRLLDIEKSPKMLEFTRKAGHMPACVNCISKRS